MFVFETDKGEIWKQKPHFLSQKIKSKNHIAYRFMPMIILSYLFINLYLVMIGSSWCQSEGCEISKSLLHIDQTELYGLAIVAFAVLSFIGLKILKTDSSSLKEFYKFSIFTIMICETILLGYLYFKSGALCISCFIFYLLVIANYWAVVVVVARDGHGPPASPCRRM